MRKLVFGLLVAATAVTMPGHALAGTSSATGTAALTVVNQCSVTGANVSLGTYTVNQTWGDVGAALGLQDASFVYTAGSLGFEYLNFGSVICDAGTAYSLQIRGSGLGGMIRLTQGGKVSTFLPAVKKLGGTVLADSNNTFYPGTGAHVSANPLSATGTGAAQALVGNVVFALRGSGNTSTVSDVLGSAGLASDTLTYTLTF